MAQFELSSEQVPEELYWLYELVGMDHFLKIIDTAGGEFLYFPKRSTLERTLRRQAIAKEYDGSNVRQLARKYGLSDRHIRTILQEAGLRRPS
jgi:Mor family transcriptional regulator